MPPLQSLDTSAGLTGISDMPKCRLVGRGMETPRPSGTAPRQPEGQPKI